MPQPNGSRNRDYSESRRDLARRISATMEPESIVRASLREFGASAGVSLPTLLHYFADAGEVIAEVLAIRFSVGAQFREEVARADGDFATSLRELIAYLAIGLTQRQVLDGHHIGLSNGMGSRTVGLAYLESVVEPALRAVEARLKTYLDRGEMRPCEPARRRARHRVASDDRNAAPTSTRRKARASTRYRRFRRGTYRGDDPCVHDERATELKWRGRAVGEINLFYAGHGRSAT
jgi:AcrR family transcriptional regulator